MDREKADRIVTNLSPFFGFIERRRWDLSPLGHEELVELGVILGELGCLTKGVDQIPRTAFAKMDDADERLATTRLFTDALQVDRNLPLTHGYLFETVEAALIEEMEDGLADLFRRSCERIPGLPIAAFAAIANELTEVGLEIRRWYALAVATDHPHASAMEKLLPLVAKTMFWGLRQDGTLVLFH